MKFERSDRAAADVAAESCCDNPRLIAETVGCLTQRVCTSCGAVASGSDERYEHDPVVPGGGTTYVFASGVSVAASQRTRQRGGGGDQRTPRYVLKGLQLIRSLCEALQCRGEARDAEAEYQRALADDSLRFVGAASKEAVAGACVYLRARGRGDAVTLASVAALLPSRDVFALGAAVKTVTAVLGTRVPPPPDVADMVASVIGVRHRRGELQAAPPPLFTEDDVRQVTRVVELLRDLSLTGGRRPDTVVLGAAFAYEQLRRPKARLGVFLERLGASPSRQHQVSAAANDVGRALAQSCASLPWMSGRRVSPKDVWSNLDHVLRYRRCVVHEARRRSGGIGDADGATADDEVSDEALAAAIEPLAARAGEIEAALARLNDPALGESDIAESELSAFLRSAEEARSWAAARAVVDDPTAAEAHKWAAVAGASRKRKADGGPTLSELQ